MHVLHHHAAADAAGTIDPRGRAIALSVVFAAGALLLIIAPVIGASGTLGLLALLIAAFGAGWGFARAQPGSIGRPAAATRWAFLLSAAGWLLALVAWYGGGPAGAAPRRDVRQRGGGCRRRVAAGRAALSGSRVSGATALSVAVAIAATLLTRTPPGQDAAACALPSPCCWTGRCSAR